MIGEYADYPERLTVDADVAVVGTGAGGAVAAATLAEAGLDVVMIEEGGYHPTSSLWRRPATMGSWSLATPSPSASVRTRATGTHGS